MNQTDSVKVMVGAVLGLCLIWIAGALVGEKLVEKAKVKAITSAARLAPPPAFLIDYKDRPWVLHEGTGYFDFTDEEWAMIKMGWVTKGEKAELPQGPVVKTSREVIDGMATKWPGSLRTNRVWIQR